VVRNLTTVPGVGPLVGMAYVATIDDPTRFTKSRNVGAHLGLAPRRFQSGEVDRQGSISKCGDSLLRHYLYEAAGVLLTRTRRMSPLKAWGLRLTGASGGERPRSPWRGSWQSSCIVCGAPVNRSGGAPSRRRLHDVMTSQPSSAI
jgi:transposase